MRLMPARSINGRLRLPGDKSISHRAALIAALASDSSEISNFSTARDCASTLACLRELGVSIEHKSGKLFFAGGQKLVAPSQPLDCGNSGSTLRILTGVLAGHDLSAELIGDESLSSRPMRRIIEPLELMGAKIEATDGKAPLKIRGTAKLDSDHLQTSDRQRAGKIGNSLCRTERRRSNNGDRNFTVARSHRTSLQRFRRAGNNECRSVSHARRPGTVQQAARSRFPGDVSSAAYFVAAAMLLPESELTIEGVGLNPTRAAFLSVLSSWGADISTTMCKQNATSHTEQSTCVAESQRVASED